MAHTPGSYEALPAMDSPSPTPPAKRKRLSTGCALVGGVGVLLLLGFVATKLWPGDSSYDAYHEVSDTRVVQHLPPGSQEITLVKQMGGHFARYKISESNLHDYLDAVWSADRGTSAHQREQMGGEGEPASPEQIERRFGPLGWPPLPGAIQYHGPSQSSGAVTTYYYDPTTGITYHDASYW